MMEVVGENYNVMMDMGVVTVMWDMWATNGDVGHVGHNGDVGHVGHSGDVGHVGHNGDVGHKW